MVLWTSQLQDLICKKQNMLKTNLVQSGAYTIHFHNMSISDYHKIVSNPVTPKASLLVIQYSAALHFQ